MARVEVTERRRVRGSAARPSTASTLGICIVRFTSISAGQIAQKAVLADGAAHRSNRPKPTIRPELETWPFPAHIDTGDYPWAATISGDVRRNGATQRDASHCSS